MDIQQLTQQLARVRHFRDLPAAELQAIIAAGRIQRFAREAVIFMENEPCAGLFVLLEGQVQLCKLSPDGQVAILAVYEPVIMFNEVAALDQGSNPATAIALADTAAWRLEPQPLEALVLKHPQIALGMLRLLASRNRRLVSHFEDLSFRPVLARTAKLLLELSQQGTCPIDRRKNPNYQMASRIATIPEAFSRSLGIFKSNADVLCTYHSIQVLQPARLQEYAGISPWKEEAGE